MKNSQRTGILWSTLRIKWARLNLWHKPILLFNGIKFITNSWFGISQLVSYTYSRSCISINLCSGLSRIFLLLVTTVLFTLKIIDCYVRGIFKLFFFLQRQNFTSYQRRIFYIDENVLYYYFDCILISHCLRVNKYFANSYNN